MCVCVCVWFFTLLSGVCYICSVSVSSVQIVLTSGRLGSEQPHPYHTDWRMFAEWNEMKRTHDLVHNIFRDNIGFAFLHKCIMTLKTSLHFLFSWGLAPYSASWGAHEATQALWSAGQQTPPTHSYLFNAFGVSFSAPHNPPIEQPWVRHWTWVNFSWRAKLNLMWKYKTVFQKVRLYLYGADILFSVKIIDVK